MDIKNMHIIIFIFILSTISFAEDIPYEVFSWNQLEFAWPCPEAEMDAIKSGNYISKNNVIYGLARWKDKLFIISPRFKPGVAATLNYINLTEAHAKSPKLCPYPNWEANKLPESEGSIEDCQLISAEGVQVDECERLWVLDMGNEGLRPWSEQKKYADPAIVIFDLTCDRLVRRYKLKKSDVKQDTAFTRMVLDATSCGDTMAYISDAFGHGLIVYSLRQNDSWRIEHNFFYPDPFVGLFNFQSQQFAVPVGLYGVALTDIQKDGYRTAYFHCIGSNYEFQVSTKVLMNATYANSVDSYYEFQVIGERGQNTQILSSVLDQKGGILYFASTPMHSYSCWNTAQPLNPSNFKTVLKCDEVLNPFDVTIDGEENLWMLSSNIPQFLVDKVNPHEVNHRIMKMNSEEASRTCRIH